MQGAGGASGAVQGAGGASSAVQGAGGASGAVPGRFGAAWLARGGRFDEETFPIPAELRAGWEERVGRGRERMRGARAVICGLARDEAPRLPATIAQLERLAADFAEARIVIYENDSSDETPALLRAWARRDPRVTVVCETLGRPPLREGRSEARSTALADARGRCQRAALACCAGFDYALVADTDLLGFDPDGVAHTLGCDGWDAVGAKGVSFHADGVDGFVCPDVWAFRRPGQTEHTGNVAEVHRFVPPRGAPLVPVDSCFGGLAVYRMEAFASGSYAGGDCEHVTFHASLRRAGFGRIFLDPSLLALYPDFIALYPRSRYAQQVAAAEAARTAAS